MAWDVSVADTYAESHLSATTLTAAAAADKAAANKEIKYSALHCVQKKYPLSFSAISPWKMFRFTQNFQGMFQMNKVFYRRKI